MKHAIDERGSITPLLLVAMILMAMLLAISVDLSGAWLSRTARANDLAAARDQVSSAPCALVIKNANDPGRETAMRIASALRENGFEGDIKIWCYEVPKSDLPNNKQDSRRVLAWCAQVSEPYTGAFLPTLGIDAITIAASTTSSSVLYSGGTTWRPNAAGTPVGNGLYSFSATNAIPTYTTLGALDSTSLWPQTIKEAVSERIAQVKTDQL